MGTGISVTQDPRGIAIQVDAHSRGFTTTTATYTGPTTTVYVLVDASPYDKVIVMQGTSTPTTTNSIIGTSWTKIADFNAPDRFGGGLAVHEINGQEYLFYAGRSYDINEDRTKQVKISAIIIASTSTMGTVVVTSNELYDWDTYPIGLTSYGGNLLLNVDNYRDESCFLTVNVNASTGAMSEGSRICPTDIDMSNFFGTKQNFDDISFEDIFSQAAFCMYLSLIHISEPTRPY